MEQSKNQLEKLIEIGSQFTYENFSTKSEHGYTESLSPEWVSWETRCTGILKSLFDEKSAQVKALQTALDVPIIGWGNAKFELRRSYIIGVLQTAVEIIENDIFNEIKKQRAKAPEKLSNKVFVVHGHDDLSKTSLEIFLNEIGLEPIVLHRQADEGQTIIEKFEKHSDVGYAFVLLTPDEFAYLASDSHLPENKRKLESRARPNVIFEFGYFVGKLGRNRVCCLYTGDVNLPSDVNGMIYKQYQNSVEESAYSIIKDLKAAGYVLN